MAFRNLRQPTHEYVSLLYFTRLCEFEARLARMILEDAQSRDEVRINRSPTYGILIEDVLGHLFDPMEWYHDATRGRKGGAA